MNHETIKNNDPIQLKQMIIFLKAELIKYETMDSISEINELQQENRQLLNENETLAKQVAQLQKEGSHCMIEMIKELPVDLGPVNQRIETLSKKVTESINSQATFEDKMTNHHTTIQQLTEEIRDQAKGIQKREGEMEQLKKELAEKEVIIKALQNEVIQLKKENKQLSTTLNKISPEVVQQMDVQMQEVLNKALEYGEHLDDKLEMIAKIEAELMEVIHLGSRPEKKQEVDRISDKS